MMRRSMAMLALTGAAVAACDVLTEPPLLEQTWVVPGETVELSVAELLPSGISLTADTSAFIAEVPGASVVLSLDEMCGPECDPIFGSSIAVPKPAFGDTITTTTALPADLVSAVLAGGSFDVTLGHNFDFDPLRPSSDTTADRGHIRIRVLSSGNTVAETMIDGETQAFPADSTIFRSLEIEPVEVSDTLNVEVQIYSPAGDDTVLEASDTLGVSLAPATLEIAEASVALGAITMDPTSTEMDFGIDPEGAVVDQIQSGALRFRVQNPFSVTGELDIAFQLPTGTITRTLDVFADSSYTARLEFTGDELREILSAEAVELVSSGTVTAVDGTLTVTPRQELILENDFELVLLVGGSGEEEE